MPDLTDTELQTLETRCRGNPFGMRFVPALIAELRRHRAAAEVNAAAVGVAEATIAQCYAWGQSMSVGCVPGPERDEYEKSILAKEECLKAYRAAKARKAEESTP